MHLHTLALSAVASFAIASTAAAQPFAAGFRTDSFPNTTGQGTASLTARVYYPATSAGNGAPLVPPPPAGYPVVVFLHGFAALGSFYPPLGEAWARAGFVAVLGDTAQFAAGTQVLDAIATFAALRTANTQAGFYQGVLDMNRVGLCGHSMGGGSTLNVLASNPGYQLGIVLAGVDAPAGAAAARVPLLFLHGLGDTIVNVAASDNNYNAATSYQGFKTLYVLDGSCTHTNVAGILLANATDQQVFARAATCIVSFCARFLQDSDISLDSVLGSDARSEPRLSRTSTQVRAPELWRVGAPRVGTTVRLSAAGEPGLAILLLAAGRANLPTPIGDLLLDPLTLVALPPLAVDATRTATLSLLIPAEPGLAGAVVPAQIAAPTRDAPIRLGRALDLRILP